VPTLKLLPAAFLLSLLIKLTTPSRGTLPQWMFAAGSVLLPVDYLFALLHTGMRCYACLPALINALRHCDFFAVLGVAIKFTG
jgi:hypothetical protein